VCLIQNAEIDFHDEHLDLKAATNGATLDRGTKSLIFKTSTMLTIPKDVFDDFPALENIDVSNSDMSVLRDQFGGNNTAQLQKLTNLELSNNSLAWLENGTFAGATELTRLRITNNLLMMLDVLAFEGMDRLQHLDLSFNHLSVVEWSVFGQVRSLNTLLLHHNRLHKIESITSSPPLTILHLGHNELASVDGLEQQTNLTELVLSWNPQLQVNVTVLFEDMEDLRKLHMGRVIRSELTIEFFPVMHQLESLFLDHNNLHTIEGYQSLRSKFPKLRDLDISHNLFTCSFLTLLLVELREWGISLRRKDRIFDDNHIDGIWCKDVVTTWDPVDDGGDMMDDDDIDSAYAQLTNMVEGINSLLRFYGWYFTAIGVILLVLIIAVLVNCLFNLQPAIVARRRKSKMTLIELLESSGRDHERL
jgi:Leucine rich repeat